MELSPLETIICWYVDLGELHKQKASKSLKKLFNKMPDYKKDIKDTFSDEAELEDLGPQLLAATFFNLKKDGTINFIDGTYAVDKEKCIVGCSEYYIINSADLDTIISDGLEFIAKAGYSAPQKNDLIKMGKLLRILFNRRLGGDIVTIPKAELPGNYNPPAENKKSVKFDPRVFVNETRDYNAGYAFLKTRDIRKIISVSLDRIEEVKVPGLVVEKA